MEDIQNKYKSLFRKYYPGLLFYATRLLDEGEAEDVIQDVFLEVWNRKELMDLGDGLQAYLYRMVYSRAVNIHKHKRVEEGYQVLVEEIHNKRMAFYHPDQTDVIKHIENEELRKEIYLSINNLPEKCREIFKLSYLYNMKNKAIADLLGISVRTVESHIYKALRILRDQLRHLLSLIFLFFIHQ
ncbi:MAG: RNA polymerase sigma-70 factor [Tannerellaceae bacterium]|nr:RNA polymerase sigma-70 factor [Tannerellaceae bacterium]